MFEEIAIEEGLENLLQGLLVVKNEVLDSFGDLIEARVGESTSFIGQRKLRSLSFFLSSGWSCNALRKMLK